MVRQALQNPRPPLGPGGLHPTIDCLPVEEYPARGQKQKTGGWTHRLFQDQGAGQRSSTLPSQLQEPSLSPLGTGRLGASVLQPQPPPKPLSLTTEVPATAQLPSQPSHPSPGHSCTHKSGAEREAQGQGRGRWLGARAELGHRQQGEQPVGGAQLEELLSVVRAAAGAQWAREQWRAGFQVL